MRKIIILCLISAIYASCTVSRVKKRKPSAVERIQMMREERVRQ